MRTELIVTIGIPGSGKSTWARAEAFDLEHFGKPVVIVERDLIREEITGSIRNFTREGVVTGIAENRVRTALSADITVIVSDTNLMLKYRNKWRKVADECNAHYREVVIDAPIEVCIERDAQRDQPVGEEVIRKMHEKFVATTKGEQ